jgi:hypothetical protein
MTTGNPNDLSARLAAMEKQNATLEEAMGKLIDIVSNQGKVVESVKAGTVQKKRLFGSQHAQRVAILDTKTNITYPSLAAVSKALAGEFGVDPADHFGYYKISSKAPDRFKRLEGAEAQKTWDASDATNKKIVDETNAKIAAEKAAAEKKAVDDATAAAALEAAKKAAAAKKQGK